MCAVSCVHFCLSFETKESAYPARISCITVFFRKFRLIYGTCMNVRGDCFLIKVWKEQIRRNGDVRNARSYLCRNWCSLFLSFEKKERACPARMSCITVVLRKLLD